VALVKAVGWSLTVLEDGVLEVRRATRVLEDGVVVGERLHRQVLVPGDALTGMPARIQQIATLVWTPAVIAAYAAAHPPVV
jgi:hypothetical protein